MVTASPVHSCGWRAVAPGSDPGVRKRSRSELTRIPAGVAGPTPTMSEPLSPRRPRSMLNRAGASIGRDVDLGSVVVTADRIRQYAAAVGDNAISERRPLRVAPLGFALALRGGPLPAVELAADTVSVHGGHAITSHRPLTAPGVYRIQARVADVFEKNGRSGALTVIARRAEIHAAGRIARGDGRRPADRPLAARRTAGRRCGPARAVAAP